MVNDACEGGMMFVVAAALRNPGVEIRTQNASAQVGTSLGGESTLTVELYHQDLADSDDDSARLEELGFELQYADESVQERVEQLWQRGRRRACGFSAGTTLQRLRIVTRKYLFRA